MIPVCGMADTIWTTADRDAVKAAILEFALGKRVVSVTYSPPGAPQRTVTYTGPQGLADLRSLLADMNRELGGGATYRLASTRKGLGA